MAKNSLLNHLNEVADKASATKWESLRLVVCELNVEWPLPILADFMILSVADVDALKTAIVGPDTDVTWVTRFNNVLELRARLRGPCSCINPGFCSHYPTNMRAPLVKCKHENVTVESDDISMHAICGKCWQRKFVCDIVSV